MRGVYDRWVFNRGDLEGQPNPRTWGIGWRYRVRYIDAATGKECELTFPDGAKGKAESFAAEQHTHRREGRSVSVKGGKTLIRVYGPEYVDSLVVADSTRRRYLRILNDQVIPHLGGHQLAQPTSTTIQTWVAKLTEEGYSPASVRLAYEFTTAMFKRAVRDRLVPYTPCEEITLPVAPDREYWIPEHHQVRELADAMPARYRALVYVSSGCGTRRSETFALDLDSIDFTKKVLRVHSQLVWVQGSTTPVLAKLKTRKAFREVPLPGHVIAALREHIAAGHVQKVQIEDRTVRVRKGQPAPVVTKHMLFAHKGGEFLSPSGWGRVWGKVRGTVTGIDPKFTLHGLRHYFASVLINGGSNAVRVAKLCGHSSEAITLKVYTHLFKDDADRSCDILDAAFAEGAKTEPLGHVVQLPKPQEGETGEQAA